MFGVSSDEYLNYARMNREEWEKKGEEVVAGFVQKYGGKQEDDAPSTASTELSCFSDERIDQPSAKVQSRKADASSFVFTNCVSC